MQRVSALEGANPASSLDTDPSCKLYFHYMSHTIPVVYDSGVFRPLEPVDLAPGTRAEVIPLTADPQLAELAAESAWPNGYFDETAGALAGERIERPAQGDLPQRDTW